MEFWLRLARAEIAQEIRAGQNDVVPAYALLQRVFMLAIELRRDGDPRLWNDLMTYASEVEEAHAHR
ncbi:hypothetical protein OIE69_43885 (plasmid) [Actinacidiphila glaucinigra]|uniref:hypothetical protein n=1 Tax=Actinacidiphila glaucinigra TaxID=235986 RepID=UPI002DD8BAC9|nr:hypothetical protein [Actinacidiphila glaucinigra]WSD65846.1 hypothetical protein OIE69_43885 [Actinacidiphila glaucinigra]